MSLKGGVCCRTSEPRVTTLLVLLEQNNTDAGKVNFPYGEERMCCWKWIFHLRIMIRNSQIKKDLKNYPHTGAHSQKESVRSTDTSKTSTCTHRSRAEKEFKRNFLYLSVPPRFKTSSTTKGSYTPQLQFCCPIQHGERDKPGKKAAWSFWQGECWSKRATPPLCLWK